MDFNFKNLPPQKKRVLAIGGIAFVVLLFLSFLLSLSEDNVTQPQQQQTKQTQQPQQQAPNQDLKLPSSQRYDFEHNQNTQDQGLENLLEKEQAPGPAPIPSTDSEEQEVHEEILRAEEKKSYFLHCNSFDDEKAAEQGKAMLAFQGIMASVESHEGKYRLRIGPFDKREDAQQMFNEQSNKGLLNECRLIGK